jgi:hypothetical protein
MYPHMAIDGYGFEALVADLVNLDSKTGGHLAPRQGIQPMDLARLQRTAAVKRQSAASIKYWERLLREVPARRFNGPYAERAPRWWDVTYDSRAAHLAVNSIAARTGLHTGPILLAAYAVVMARLTGVNPSVIRTLVSNRFRPDFAESVSLLVQPGLCVIDVADCSFDEAATRAWHSQLTTGKYGYYDPRDLWELMERVTRERGTEVDIMCYFNDGRRMTAAAPDGPPPTEEEMWAALPETAFAWGVRTDVPDVKLYFDVNPVPHTVNFTLRADTKAVSLPEQLTVARGIEEILLAAAFDPASPTGVASAM